jgi:hypothetical protein
VQALDEKAARLFDPEVQPGPADPRATYAHFWRECGGQQSLDELESLSNECARACNRRRSKLDVPGQERLDRAFASLAPTFDVQVPPVLTADGYRKQLECGPGWWVEEGEVCIVDTALQ